MNMCNEYDQDRVNAGHQTCKYSSFQFIDQKMEFFLMAYLYNPFVHVHLVLITKKYGSFYFQEPTVFFCIERGLYFYSMMQILK